MDCREIMMNAKSELEKVMSKDWFYKTKYDDKDLDTLYNIQSKINQVIKHIESKHD